MAAGNCVEFYSEFSTEPTAILRRPVLQSDSYQRACRRVSITMAFSLSYSSRFCTSVSRDSDFSSELRLSVRRVTCSSRALFVRQLPLARRLYRSMAEPIGCLAFSFFIQRVQGGFFKSKNAFGICSYRINKMMTGTSASRHKEGQHQQQEDGMKLDPKHSSWTPKTSIRNTSISAQNLKSRKGM